MKKEKAEFLLTRYRDIFPTFLKKERGAYIDIAVGDGWYDLITNMLRQLEKIISRVYSHSNIIVMIDCRQLKEKLGGLRFYYKLKLSYESKGSIFFRKANNYIGLKLCRMKLYRQWWAFDRFRQKHLYQTIYEKISTIVSEAESKSFKICEVCGDEGSRGTPQGTSWVATLCKKHYDESSKK